MKKFLTVLLVIAVMFTFSFGSAFAITADEALAQALASAKTSAVQALNSLVNLNDYDAVGQAEVKEIIEEGTDLINLQTDVTGVTETLSAYQTKLIAVKNADLNAVAAAKKAAKESVEDYIDVLVASGCYTAASFTGTKGTVKDYATQIDNQATVVGVELVLGQIYAAIEKTDMTSGATDAAEAKALAEAKAAALKVVRGEADAAAKVITDAKITKWDNLATKVGGVTIESLMTKEQIAAYKAKVNEVVADIKDAKTPEAIATIIDREAAEVADLLAETEKEAAQEAVYDAVYAWAEAASYELFGTNYGKLKAAVETLAFADDATTVGFAYYNDGTHKDAKDENGKLITVAEMDDVADATAALIELFEDAYTSDLSTVQGAAVAVLANYQGYYKNVELADLAKAEQEIYAATTKEDIAAIKTAYMNKWRAASQAVDTVYDKAVADAIAAVQAEYAKLAKAATALNSGEWKAADEIVALFEANIKTDRTYDWYVAGSPVISDFQGLATYILAGLENNTIADYAGALAKFVEYADDVLAADALNTNYTDAAYSALEAGHRAKLAAAKTLTEALAVYTTGYDELVAYKAATAVDANIKRFAAYKEAVKVIDALPDTDEVTLNDKAAVVAAYKAYVTDGVIKTFTYIEDYGTTAVFIGEKEAYDKIDALYTEVTDDATTGTLAAELKAFKDYAYSNYLTSTKYDDYTAEQQAALDAAYNAGVAAISAAAQTGYADDVANVEDDAEYALYIIANKAEAKALAKLIADAKAFLATTYDAADYSATGLAKIAEIIAAVGGVDEEAVAKATIAARKAIAAVNDTVESEALNKALKDIEVKAYLQDLEVVARSAKTAKGNVKVTVKADVTPILEAGYTVEYKFYRSEYSNKKFGAAKKVSAENTYTNTKGEKGTKYYYKAVIVAKDAEGTVIASTPLKHCLYACRTWTK